MPHAHHAKNYSLMDQVVLLLRAMRRFIREAVGEVDAISQSLALEEPSLPKLLRFSISMLSAAVLCFIVWASLTDVKEIARTEGQVVPSGYSQLVQHLEGGLVREILVHEGDFVQEGQLLLKLDGAGTEEDLGEQKEAVKGRMLQAERLHALLEMRLPDVTKAGATPEQVLEQQRMYNSMREAWQTERNVLGEQIAQKEKALERIKQAYSTAIANLGLARESRGIYARLAEQKLAPRSIYLQKQAEFNTRSGDVQSLSRQIEEASKELNEYRGRLKALAAQQRDVAYTDLHKLESELAQAREDLKKRTNRVERLEVRAPVMGYVKGLKLNTIGSVIPAGQTLMEIVPVDEQLIVEVRIDPKEIGRVEKGQSVRVKVDSYDYVRYGTIEGSLESISAMTFTDEARHQDYYKGKVRLAHNYAGSVATMNPVIPGMTVDADIVTGEKSILGYLLKPIRSALYNAMTEQ